MMHVQHDAQVVHHCCNRTRLRVPDGAAIRSISTKSVAGFPNCRASPTQLQTGRLARSSSATMGEFRMEAVTEALHGAALVVLRGRPRFGK
jgi:hypothetical protein